MRGNRFGMFIVDSLKNLLGFHSEASGQDFGAVLVLGQQHVNVAAAADTNENTLFTLPIRGGTMRENDTLRISYMGEHTNNVNLKTWKVKLGATVIFSFGETASTCITNRIILSNRNAVNSQICNGQNASPLVLAGSVPSATYAIDFAQDQVLTITGTKAVAGDVMVLEQVLIELVRAGGE